MTTLYLVQGDIGAQIKTTITREDTGNAVNMADATVLLKFKKANTANVLFTVTASDLSDFENGEAIFIFSESNLTISSGNYIGEVCVNFDSGDIETVFETLDFVVREDF